MSNPLNPGESEQPPAGFLSSAKRPMKTYQDQGRRRSPCRRRRPLEKKREDERDRGNERERRGAEKRKKRQLGGAPG